MILFVLICSLIVIAVLEKLSRREDLRRLYVTFSADMLALLISAFSRTTTTAMTIMPRCGVRTAG